MDTREPEPQVSYRPGFPGFLDVGLSTLKPGKSQGQLGGVGHLIFQQLCVGK